MPGSPNTGAGTTTPAQNVPTFTPPAGQSPFYTTATFQSGTSSQEQQQTGNSQTSTTGNQSNANVYNPESQALQGMGANMLQQVMATGQLPGNFGISDQAFDALNRSFQRNIAPGMAAQYGAGSPAIASQQTLMNEQLAAQLSQQQWGNFNNLFDDVANFAFTATGQNANNTSNQNVNEEQEGSQQGAWQTNNTVEGAMFAGLLNALAGKKIF